MNAQSDSPQFSAAAQWIWGDDDIHERNMWRYFRHTFAAPADMSRATLLITADTLYSCTINGAFLGRGPVRGFPFAYWYDVYDITASLEAGAENVLAVLVNHLADHTMSYIRGRAGLLCELILERADGTVVRAGSGDQWRTTPCAAFNASATRIAVQLGFEEQYDARQELVGWNTAGYDDRAWRAASIVGPVGCAPWTSLSPRTIPFLTEDDMAPAEITAVELARPRQGTIWNLDVRDLAGTMRTGLRTAPPGERGWLLFTEITAPKACTVKIHRYPNYEAIAYRINDTVVEPTGILEHSGGPKEHELHTGPNLFMIRSAEWPSILFECEEELEFSGARFAPDAAWVFTGPFNELNGELEQRWQAASLDDLPASDPKVAIPAQANKTDIFALTASQEFFAVDGGFCSYAITRATPRPYLPDARPNFVAAPTALLFDNQEWTTIHPQPDGDVHIVVDFGKETIGYLELDLDAPAGAIVDGNCFEGIDDSGIFWTMNTRSSFRYTCREGRQLFRSHERRGLRYVSLTFRNLDRPLRLRRVANKVATYPVEQAGHFACSDETLTKIWEVAAYTVRLCMLDTYVDCPTYEQVYWVGDARNSALVNAVAFGAYPLTDRCVRLTGQSLSPELKMVKPPHLEAMRTHITTSHVVSGWFDEIPMWTFLWVWMAWEQYWMTGDVEALADYYADVAECLRRCATFLTPRDLLDIPDVWNLVDWAAQDLERDGEVISNTVLMAQALDRAAQMADVLGQSEETEAHRALAQRLRDAVNRYGWSDEYRGYVDTVRDEAAYATYKDRRKAMGAPVEPFADFQKKLRISEPTNTLVLLCNAVPPERYEAVVRYVEAAKEGKFVGSSPWMARMGRTEEIVPVGSPWFLFFTLETLFNHGYADDALTILREQWNRMLEKGATTFWETFPGFVGGHWSRSLCHGWSAAPAYFLSTRVLGVTAAAPGYAKIRLAPKPWHLRWARGTVPTPHGPVSVAWEVDESGKLQLEYNVPEDCEVEVEI
ncbi:MAG: family 78 glycoside hydrolase catalytic domain [Caldilineaceae bacterium]|nr:family 78 glycoside hydrolase catalytic domain [Caldilineaceae bacterium]